MPGNEVGDRVHNFFAQDNLPQGQHHSQVGEGSWPVLNNNFWAGSQKQIGVSSSSPRDYTSVQSDLERGHNSHPLHVPHGLNFAQNTLRPEFVKSQPQSQQTNLNGYIYGRQNFQARQDEANFLGVDTESDRHNVNPRGLSIYESQQGGVSEHITKSSVRSDTSDTPISFDLFGGQQQLNSQHASLLQGLPQQQSGFAEMQQLQQQLMFRKMQELQRQKELRQLDARQQTSVTQVSSFARQASGGHPHTLINGNPVADASTYPWGELTAGNTNWLQRASPAMQGTSSGLVFSPEQGQAPRSMGFGHQQVDQSLYGVPVSNSRGNPNQYPRTSIQQMPAYNNSFPGNQYGVFPDQGTMQDGTLLSRQGLHGKSLHEHTSGQSSNSGINVDHLQQLNPLQQSSSVQEFLGPQELVGSSEILQDKTAMADAASHSAVSLDPTEEKILFGSDDNIWDAFGSDTNMGGGASNLLDGNGFLNGLPSVQSGSWSALMQSAVAETSSSDIGLQEELAGLNFQNSELATGAHQPSTYNGSEKRQAALADDNLRTASALSFGSVPISDGANINNNYRNAMGFQQYGQKVAYEHGEGLQINSSERLNPQSSGGSKWFNRGAAQKSHAEGSQIFENVSRSMEVGMDGKSSSAHWTSQHSGSSQVISKPNNWNAIESVAPSGDAVQNFNRSEPSLRHPQSNDQKRVAHEEMGHADSIWKVNSIPKSTVDFEPVKSSLGSPQMIREGFAVNNVAVIPNSSIGAQVGEDTGQLLPNNHPLNYWKHVDSSVKSKGTEGSGKLQHHLNKGPQVSESSLNSFDKEELKMHEIQSSNRKENNSDSYRSNLSHLVTAGGLRENLSTDAGDSRSLPGGRQKSSNQVGRKTSGPRKFQFHPMGDLDEDVEPSYETRNSSRSEAMSQQHSSGLKGQEQGFFGLSKLFGQVPKNSADTGKGHILDQQGEAKGYNEARSRGVFPGYMPNMFAAIDRSAGLSTPNNSQPSQNMLELLHKVDQSREHGTMKHFNPSEHNQSSEIPDAENSDGSVGHLQRSQSSNSQGFGLQLAPPLQRYSVPNHASPSTVQTVHSNSLSKPDIRDKGHPELAPPPYSVQSLPPSQETSHGELKNDRIGNSGQTGSETSVNRMSGNFSSALSSGFPYLRSQLQSQSKIGARGHAVVNHSDNLLFDRHAPGVRQTDESCSRVLIGQPADGSLPNAAGYGQYTNAASFDTSRTISVSNSRERVQPPQPSVGEKFPVPQPGPTSGISQQGASSKMMPNLWTDVPAQQHSLGTQAHKFHANLPQSHQLNIVESTSSGRQHLENQDAEKRGNFPSELGASSVNSQGSVCVEDQLTKGSPSQKVSLGNTDLVHKMNESQVNESLIRHTSDVSSVNPASTQRDLEAFGRSLKPNNFHQSYSLLNQMRAMKESDSDPSNRGSKRLKGSDNSLGGQQVVPSTGQPNERNNMMGDVTARRSTAPSADSKMLSFSGPVDNVEKNTPSQLGNVPLKDVLAFRQNESQSYAHGNNIASVKAEHSQISPQMAPSWFNQYGTFKNGQILTMYDMRKAAAMKTVEQPFNLGNSSGSLETDKSKELVNAAADTGQLGAIVQNSAPPSVAIEHFSSPLPTNVGGQNFVVLRPKKRKSLHPWHKEVSQASRNLHTISMAAAEWAKAANRRIEKVEDDGEVIEEITPRMRPKKRLILTTQLMQQLLRPPPATILSADATANYESVSYFVARLALGDACSLVSSVRSFSDVPHGGSNLSKPSERIDDQHLSEVMEDFMGRARKMENDLLRLDKRASVLDLRVECQDIEKFSVINRFAKFHGRGQSDGAESSSSDAAGNAQKSFPQRYVTAVPLPKNLPDRVQCLSL